MSPIDILTFALTTIVIACAWTLFSYRFFGAYRQWPIGDFGYKRHLPGILGCVLMLFAILVASSLGWPYVVAAVLVGIAVSHLYVNVLRLWVGVALLGPLLAGALTFVVRTGSWT
jgi:hypothetical protein